MQKRKLGNTGLELSVLGMGGFHLVEVPLADATTLLNAYLDEGGNYVETAAGYGDGLSEQKIGRAIGGRRESFVLASKSTGRQAGSLRADLERTLANLGTDHLDILFMHAVQTHDDVEAILAPGGALEAAQAAQQEGKIRFIGITGHGRPDSLLEAIDRFPFAVLMTGFNYLDRFNFPAVERELMPRASAKGVGLLAMKAFADGFLYRSAETALRYALGLPVASVVAGANTMELLHRDLAIVRDFQPLTGPDREEMFRTAPELGDYVCRLCGLCRESSFDPEEIFLLEGMFDRQMDDGRVPDAARYALRERLKHWFDQAQKAQQEYAALARKVDPAVDYRGLNIRCPYGIDIDRKLKLAHGKLSAERYIA